ncbi:MAG TPA: beta-propeller fold lactonase family protein [Nitrososphaeraceae archaeon]|nr:beta-propeller fold lactonase family protein [Nitrososphaeraceae archaeon]
MLVFKDYSMPIVTVYLLILSLLSFSIPGDINAYGISHDKKLAGKSPDFPDSAESDQKLNGKINKNLSIPENSKIKDGESKDGLIKPLPSELTIVTQVNNEGGGKKNPSDFTIQVDGNNPNPSSFPGDSDGTIVKLDQGKYSVSESEQSGYTVGKSASCSGTINPGQTKTCTITNTYNSPLLTGTVKVVNKVVNDGGGSKGPSDFTITVNGNDPQPTSFPGSSAGVNVNLKKGSYSVTEVGPSDYNVDYSSACLGKMNPGNEITCTITNVYQPEDQSAQLIVIKDVVNNYNNDDSATKLKPTAFTIKVSGNDPSPRSFPGRSGSGITVTLDPGSYSVTEKGPPGYSTTYSNGCEGKIKAGQAKVCIITNEVNPPQPVIPQQSQLSVIGTISDLTLPYGMAFKSDNNLLYVTNSGILNNMGSISVINTTTDNIDAIIPVGNNPKAVPVGNNPKAVIYNSANDFIYITNSNSGVISIINTTTNLITDTVNIGNFLGTGLSGIEVNPINNTIYVTNSGLNIISLINGTSNTVMGNISQTTGKFFSPDGIAYNYDNGNLYVTNRGSDTVSVINSTTKNLVKIISTGGIAPSSIIYNPVNNYLYVANTGSDTVSVINGTTNDVVKTISTDARPIGITYNEYDGNVYVTNSINGTVSVIDGLLNTVIDTIDVFGNNNNLTGIVFNSNNENVYVANTNAGSIYILG